MLEEKIGFVKSTIEYRRLVDVANGSVEANANISKLLLYSYVLVRLYLCVFRCYRCCRFGWVFGAQAVC